MSKRYQIFVSSTFRDLQQVRQAVLQSLLQHHYIPVGMELFPATNDSIPDFIKKVIDECDYYMVLIGEKKGSTGRDGKTFTRMEYDYAFSRKKPIIAFLDDNPASSEARRNDPDLQDFEALLQSRHNPGRWKTESELIGKVHASLSHAIQETPAIGWVRASAFDDHLLQMQLNGRTRVFESIEIYHEATNAVLNAQERILSVVDWLVPYKSSGEGNRRAKYYEELWNKVTSSNIKYKRIVQVPWLGADKERRNPQFVSHLKQCIEKRNKSEPNTNIELLWCEKKQQRVGFVIIDSSILVLELSQFELIDRVECGKSTEFVMIEDRSVIEYFERTFELLKRHSRRLEMDDIKNFVGFN